MMLQTPTFKVENRSVTYQVLQRTKQGKADFSDYLIGVIATHAGSQETVTFDCKLKGQSGFLTRFALVANAHKNVKAFYLRRLYPKPVARIELATSPLPRVCSTTELHGQK